jgi:hypothetical protein
LNKSISSSFNLDEKTAVTELSPSLSLTTWLLSDFLENPQSEHNNQEYKPADNIFNNIVQNLNTPSKPIRINSLPLENFAIYEQNNSVEASSPTSPSSKSELSSSWLLSEIDDALLANNTLERSDENTRFNRHLLDNNDSQCKTNLIISSTLNDPFDCDPNLLESELSNHNSNSSKMRIDNLIGDLANTVESLRNEGCGLS